MMRSTAKILRIDGIVNIGSAEYWEANVATTVDIPEEVLTEAQRLTGLTTKKAVVNLAMSELVQSYRQRDALSTLAHMDHNPFLTEEELAAPPADR
jgi:Arc/MetJ family transcription regulator